MLERILSTVEARKVIDVLRVKNGELLFHQSGGCCDGSAPMCFQVGELMLNEQDVKIGMVYGCNFYMSKDQFEYWKYTQLTLDVIEGRGSSFSLEIPLGIRFIIKSRLFSDEERLLLTPVQYGA